MRTLSDRIKSARSVLDRSSGLPEETKARFIEKLETEVLLSGDIEAIRFFQRLFPPIKKTDSTDFIVSFMYKVMKRKE